MVMYKIIIIFISSKYRQIRQCLLLFWCFKYMTRTDFMLMKVEREKKFQNLGQCCIDFELFFAENTWISSQENLFL